MKRVTVWMLIAAMVCTMFTGCGKKEADQSGAAPEKTAVPAEQSAQESKEPAKDAGGEKQKVSMWFWGPSPEQQEVLNKSLVETYNNSQDEYELVLEYRNSVDDDIAVALAAGEGADIIYGSGPAFIMNYAEAGRLANLDEYAKQYGWEDKLTPPVYNTGFVKDSLYSLPSAMYCAGIFYNKDVLAEHNWEVPATVDELTKIMDEAQAAGLQSMLFGISGWKPSLDIVVSAFLNVYAGPQMIYDCLTGKESFNNEKMVKAVEISKEWYEKGYFTEDMYAIGSSDCAQMLLDGASPFALNGSSGYQRMATFFLGDDQDKVGFLPFPSLTGDTEYILATTATWSINENSKCKDAAAAVLDILVSEEFTKEMTAVWPGYWTGALNDFSNIDTSGMSVLGRQSTEAMVPLAKAVQEGKFGYYSSTFFPSATADELTNIDTVWMGETTAQEFMDHVAEIFKGEFEKGLVPKVEEPGK